MKNDATQFALAPFAPQQIPIPAATPSLDYANSIHPDTSSEKNQLDNIYPEIYHDVYPLVLDAVNQLITAGTTPTPEIINAVVNNIIRNSGMWYEDEDDDLLDQNPEAIPVQLGFGRMPYQRRRRRYHNRNTLRDVIRILLLNELFRRGGGHYPVYY